MSTPVHVPGNTDPMNSHPDSSRRKLLAQGLAAATAVALPAFSLQARAQGRPVLKAGDQKGGLRALLEAAGGSKAWATTSSGPSFRPPRRWPKR
jgi:hypothetical protein